MHLEVGIRRDTGALAARLPAISSRVKPRHALEVQAVFLHSMHRSSSWHYLRHVESCKSYQLGSMTGKM